MHSLRITPPTIGAVEQPKIVIVDTRYGVTKRLSDSEIYPLGPVKARIRCKSCDMTSARNSEGTSDDKYIP